MKKSYSILVVPDAGARVRRARVTSRALGGAVAVLAVAGALLAAGLVDYARLRRDARDLATLRVEALAQRQQIEQLQSNLAEVGTRLERIGALERRVREIANLPGAEPSAQGAGDAIGVGGGTGGEDWSAEGPPGTEPGSAVGDSSALAPELDPSAILARDGRAAELAPWLAARAGLEAGARPRPGLEQVEQLAARADVQEASLSQLVVALQHRSRRLASTPSIWPARGWVSSRFGNRASPFTGRRQFHSGIDIAAYPGSPVLASARGRVVFAGRKGPLGRAVVIDHGYGLRTTYGHASEIHVRVGDEVQRGQRIASVGNTGRSTGSHLHYAVEHAGRAVDPARYIVD